MTEHVSATTASYRILKILANHLHLSFPNVQFQPFIQRQNFLSQTESQINTSERREGRKGRVRRKDESRRDSGQRVTGMQLGEVARIGGKKRRCLPKKRIADTTRGSGGQ